MQVGELRAIGVLNISDIFKSHCRDVLPYGIYMLVYQNMCRFLDNLEYVKKKRMKQRKLDTSFEMGLTTIAGATAGVLSWICVIPFDVIKTIMQAEQDTQYKNMTHCLKENISVSLIHYFYSQNKNISSFTEEWMEICVSWKLDVSGASYSS